MKIEVFTFNPVQENTFVIYDETNGECAIIDPGCFNNSEFEQLTGFLSAYDLKPVKLINTHGHFDHIFGVERCRKAFDLKWEAHPGDAFWVENAPAKGALFGIKIDPVHPAEISLQHNDEIKIGNSTLKVIHVPGHSPGSICLYNEEDKTLIAGDVLFRGSIGRTDLEQGSHETLISEIKSKLLVLPNDVVVYPGHGPKTTIGYEKVNNPYLQD
jgi:hydroxyacylglutathione hydrolase